MWKGQCLSFSGDVDSTAHDRASENIRRGEKHGERRACLRRVEQRARVLLSLSSSLPPSFPEN